MFETRAKSDKRYVAIETGDGELVIYDQEETTAWLQSDVTVSPTV
jgi:hypothetical protein